MAQGTVYFVPGGAVGSHADRGRSQSASGRASTTTISLGSDAAMLDSDGDGLTDFAAANGYGTSGEVTQSGATYLWLGPSSGTASAATAARSDLRRKWGQASPA